MTATPTSRATSAPTPAPTAPAPPTGTGLLVGVLVVATFVMVLNETIVSVALPTLATDLGYAAECPRQYVPLSRSVSAKCSRR